MRLEHRDITEVIIGAAFELYNVIGYGSSQKVYSNVEFRLMVF
jgi:hypothetical protein